MGRKVGGLSIGMLASFGSWCFYHVTETFERFCCFGTLCVTTNCVLRTCRQVFCFVLFSFWKPCLLGRGGSNQTSVVLADEAQSKYR